jgi:hypothetical protein
MSPVDSDDLVMAARAALRLAVAWTLLNVLCQMPVPGPERATGALLPALDATVLVAIVAAFAALKRRAPRALVAAAALFVTAIFLFRVGDGGCRRYFNRPISLGLDLRLWMDGIRLLADTMPRAWLIVAIPLALGALAAVARGAAWALRAAERAFAVPAALAAFAGALAVGAALGGLQGSAVPRIVRELRFAADLDSYRAAERARIDAVARDVTARPHGLEKLGRADVLLFLVESYGAVVIDEPDHARRLGPVYDSLTAALEARGFTVASALLESPTYAGRSWLAHTTLMTGVRTTDVVTDRLVQERRPPTLARFFHDAGYRTVLVEPANHYRDLPRWLYGFDVAYSGWDFDYRGPKYRWADMPDQYVIDFIDRHEVRPPHGPLLAAYALISSHAPWSDLPAFVDDWSRLGDGAVYDTLPVAHFPIGWTNLGDAAEAYDRSIAYDLRVLADYATRSRGSPLIIVLGDHQPVAEVTRFSASSAVPLHVLSRDPALVAPFLARGYARGLRPRRGDPLAPEAIRMTSGSPRGMEAFLPALLADFSGGGR